MTDLLPRTIALTPDERLCLENTLKLLAERTFTSGARRAGDDYVRMEMDTRANFFRDLWMALNECTEDRVAVIAIGVGKHEDIALRHAKAAKEDD